MISKGSKSASPTPPLSELCQADIASHYFNVSVIPCLMHSPLRRDNHPSFTLYSPNGSDVNYRDFATGESGTIFGLMARLWNCSFPDALRRIADEVGRSDISIVERGKETIERGKMIDLRCKVREWEDYDMGYWKSYGITLDWLKYADVHPISHKIIVKSTGKYVFAADKYAYAYAEFKEGVTTLKIYQPFNTNGFKWCNNHDKSVISLWTKVPAKAPELCVCSSLKDALCLWSNVGIPSIAVQGEGYSMSDTAVRELKRRFDKVYVCLDNDQAGIKEGKRLSGETGFSNIVLPEFNGGKDISDLYKVLDNKKLFVRQLKRLFNDKERCLQSPF